MGIKKKPQQRLFGNVFTYVDLSQYAILLLSFRPSSDSLFAIGFVSPNPIAKSLVVFHIYVS